MPKNSRSNLPSKTKKSGGVRSKRLSPLSRPRVPDFFVEKAIFNWSFHKRESIKPYERSNQKRAVENKISQYSQMQFVDFASLAGLRDLPHPKKKVSRPKEFGLDQAPLRYFRITGKIRCLGCHFDNTFFILVIDLNHDYT